MQRHICSEESRKMYEELVKMLRKHYDEHCPLDRASGICGGTLANNAADAIEELDEKCQALAETLYAYEHPWIPVTEEPPLKVGYDGYNGYLVYANGYYKVADYTTDKFDNIPYFHVDGEYEPNVTHYMPLPQPPTECRQMVTDSNQLIGDSEQLDEPVSNPYKLEE